ncbi:aspartyl-phosphate phosphatase Spo0E family protein [Clostridium acidisoli]|uniref:aspartyl-phosphate phosphatase Spo0E family protein n=1 Tax=Clostridium acidisoli TaxID=91624 RepID=UPI000A064102|nr:aspartyl-phosphate phosphatase Spo0E family protein [Clostridium acidisoli]
MKTLEKLREELYNCIEKFGLNDPRTIAKSQELDKPIVKIQKIIWRNKSCVK